MDANYSPVPSMLQKTALSDLWQWLTVPAKSIHDSEQRQQAYRIASTLVIVLPLLAMAEFVYAITSDRFPFYFLPLLIFLAAFYALSRTQYYYFSIIAVLTILSLLPVIGLVESHDYSSESVRTFLIWLVPNALIASLLLSVRGTAVVMLADITLIFALPILAPDLAFVHLTFPLGFLAGVFALLFVITAIRQRHIDQINDQTTEMARSEQLFRSLVEHSHAAILLIGDDYRLIYVNKKACDLTDYNRDELAGHDFRFLLDDTSYELVTDRYRRRKAGESVPAHYEFNIVRKDGQKRRVEISAATYTNPQGQLRIIAQLLDITERKKAEEALQKAYAELEQRVQERTQELADANMRLKNLDSHKDKFIEDMSHELRTPLANLNLYLDLLEMGNPEKRAKYMDTLRQTSQRLTYLSESILTVTRLNLYQGETRAAPLDLNKIIAKVIQRHQHIADKTGVQIIFTPQTSLPPILADYTQAREVVTGLLKNSLTYTPAGHVHISAFFDEKRQQVCLEVADTGIGIEEEDMPFIFDRFYRGQRVAQSTIPGSGLGLAVVKEIVELHGGQVAVKSQTEQGSTFYVWLPAATSDTQPPPQK